LKFIRFELVKENKKMPIVYTNARGAINSGIAIGVVLLGFLGFAGVKAIINKGRLERKAATQAVANSALAPARLAHSLADSLFNAGDYCRAYDVASDAAFELTGERWDHGIGAYVDSELARLDYLANRAWDTYFASHGFGVNNN
jgi:hypothetical protein